MKPGAKPKTVFGSRILAGHYTQMLGHSKAHENRVIDVRDRHMKA